MKTITFITGNEAKATEVSRSLGVSIDHRKIELTELQSLDLEEVVEYKAKEAFKAIGSTVLVEDTSLRFHALNGLPGPLIKWFLAELSSEQICSLLSGFSDRSATGETLFGLYDGEKLEAFHGLTVGSIAKEPRGDRNFGWDPIFIPEGSDKTWAEVSLEEKLQNSMRSRALAKLQAYLKEV
jgi:non-canonical purine NTP pyrophosphatase (RdgB/HAM1 family)